MAKGYNYIIAVTGKSSSGKDSIGRVLSNQHGYKYVVSTTTRPMRSNETNHIDYHFVSEDVFNVLIDKNKLVEYRYYDTIQDGLPSRWHYGIEKSEIDLSKNNYVCVVDLVGLADLKRGFGHKVISIYIDVPEEIRRIRAVARDKFFEEDEFSRRCKDDDVKFVNVEKEVDAVFINNVFDECLASVLYFIDKEKEKRTFFTQYASL